MVHGTQLTFVAGLHTNSFITIMDEDEEDPFVDVILNVEALFVDPLAPLFSLSSPEVLANLVPFN